jgi:hypothetical protein
MHFAAVSAGELVEVVWVSLLAGIGVTLTFSLVVLGGARYATARREGRGGEALAYGGLATIAFIVFVAGVVFGVNIMLSKD